MFITTKDFSKIVVTCMGIEKVYGMVYKLLIQEK